MEAADLGSCPVCCIALECFPCCTLAKARCDTAAKYGIEESSIMSLAFACCCAGCTYFQVINQILVKENRSWGCCSVENKGAPDAAEMAR
jgi:hypothetical protein